MATRKKKVPRGKWIAASAVRFNRDGSASIIKPKRKPNVAGYKVGRTFHPIRWDPDYDPEELQKPEPGYATDWSSPRGFFVGTPKKKSRVKKRRRR